MLFNDPVTEAIGGAIGATGAGGKADSKVGADHARNEDLALGGSEVRFADDDD